MNRTRVIEAIRRGEPIARTDIVAATGLSAGLVSTITRELVDHGIVVETPLAAEARGRPRVDLSINGDAAVFAGVFIFPNGSADVQFTDARGKLLFDATTQFPADWRGERLADGIAEELRRVSREVPALRFPDGVGVSVAGAVNSDAGIIHWFPPAAPGAEPFQAMLETRLGVPVFIDNVANIIARAEQWFGREVESDHRLLVLVGPGVALATFRDGRVENGGGGINPEFGHVKVGMTGDLACPCGAKGCLVLAASMAGLVLRNAERLAPAELSMANLAALFERLLDDVRSGDPALRRCFDEAGTALGIAVANLINVSNPASVGVVVHHPGWIEQCAGAFHAAIDANVLGFLRGTVAIDLRLDEPAHYPLGAVALVLERLFERETLPDWGSRAGAAEREPIAAWR